MVEDEDIDDVTNKLLKPKTTRKSKGLSNSLKDDTLVSKSRKSDYSQVSIGVREKSVSKTESKSKHLSKVNNKNYRKSTDRFVVTFEERVDLLLGFDIILGSFGTSNCSPASSSLSDLSTVS
jgi:hypothetical protein